MNILYLFAQLVGKTNDSMCAFDLKQINANRLLKIQYEESELLSRIDTLEEELMYISHFDKSTLEQLEWCRHRMSRIQSDIIILKKAIHYLEDTLLVKKFKKYNFIPTLDSIVEYPDDEEDMIEFRDAIFERPDELVGIDP